MTDQQHPITPPRELVQQWIDCDEGGPDVIHRIATRAARWGADQELEAIIELADQSEMPEEDRYFDGMTAATIRAARRIHRAGWDAAMAAMQQQRPATPAPAGALVERVAKTISHAGCKAYVSVYGKEARAAIREVAAWLREHYGGPTASSTALEQEADRG